MRAGTPTLVMRTSARISVSGLTHAKNSRTGIGPEAFAFISSDGDFTGNGDPSADQLAFYQKHGYYITAADYILRPEVLESNFYAFRATGDTKYLDRATSAVRSFNTFLKTPGGFACLNDVNNVTAPLLDAGESFWYAEVLKYLCVVFLFLSVIPFSNAVMCV